MGRFGGWLIEPSGEIFSKRCAHISSAGQNFPHRLRNQIGGRILGQVTRCASPQDAHRILILRMHAEDENTGRRPQFLELFQNVQAAWPWHRDVEQRNVPVLLLNARERFLTVASFSKLNGAKFVEEHLLQSFSDNRMVVGKQDPKGFLFGLSGNGLSSLDLTCTSGRLFCLVFHSDGGSGSSTRQHPIWRSNSAHLKRETL